jgi:Na+/serine symporter
MMIVPLITTSLVAGITAMGHPKKLGSLGLRTLAMYMVTTFFAVWLGLLTGSILRPGQGVNYQVASEKDQAELKQKLKLGEEAGTAVERILKIIPTNPVDSMAKGDVLPIIFFALLLGMAILLTGEAGLPLKNLFDSAAEVVMRMTLIVMELAPLGVFALMTWVMASKGLSVLTNLLWLAISLYAACLIQIALVYGLVIIKLLASWHRGCSKFGLFIFLVKRHFASHDFMCRKELRNRKIGCRIGLASRCNHQHGWDIDLPRADRAFCCSSGGNRIDLGAICQRSYHGDFGVGGRCWHTIGQFAVGGYGA